MIVAQTETTTATHVVQSVPSKQGAHSCTLTVKRIKPFDGEKPGSIEVTCSCGRADANPFRRSLAARAKFRETWSYVEMVRHVIAEADRWLHEARTRRG